MTHAAVTLLLRPTGRDGTGGAEILFIKRAERAGDPWSGHLAFPGGRAEESDATLLDLAMREAAEEVGIDARHGGRVPCLEQQEVAEVFWMPIAELKSSGRSAVALWESKDGTREFPAFPSPKGPIWGITERILSQFLALADDDVPVPSSEEKS